MLVSIQLPSVRFPLAPGRPIKMLDPTLFRSPNDLISRSRNDSDASMLGAHGADLARAFPTLPDGSNGADLLNFFRLPGSPEAVAILRDGYFLGLVDKLAFIKSQTECAGQSHFRTLPWSVWSSPEPFIADASESIESMVRRAAQRTGSPPPDAFVVTQDGRYLGLGSGIALRRAHLTMETRTREEQLAEAGFQRPLQRQTEFAARQALHHAFPDHGLLHQPMGLVAGDGVYVRQHARGTLVAVLCCLRVGLPCATTQISTLNWLDKQVSAVPDEAASINPAGLLGQLHRFLQSDMRLGGRIQHADSAGRIARKSLDGVLASIAWIPANGRSMCFAGASMGMSMVRERSLDMRHYEGNPWVAGSCATPEDCRWDAQEIALDGSFRALICTPGLLTQVGGPFHEAMGQGVLNQFLKRYSALAASGVAKLLESHLLAWQGSNPQHSDITALVLPVGVASSTAVGVRETR